MVHYKLTYGDYRGLGEMSRLLLHYANIPFDDHRPDFADWPILKPSLAGKDDLEAAQLDAIADFVKDISTEITPYVLAVFKNEDNQKELYETTFKPCMDKNMPILEKPIEESGSGFFAKSGISWVDFYVATFVETRENFDKELMEKYQVLLKHKERVYAHPQLKEYLDGRSKTQF